MPLLIYQGRLNMIDRKPMDSGITAFCAEHGVGFIAFSPLAQGLLTDRYLGCKLTADGQIEGIPEGSRMTREHFLKSSTLTPELLERLQRYNQIAQGRGETLAEMALSWVLAQQAVTSVLIGASSTAQLEKNIKSVWAAPFTEVELSQL